MECRLAYSREWAIRMTHEAQLHRQNSFLTLTYADEHLPEYGQLYKRHLQLFFKRARKALGPFRYVACGEYGELRRRPHFHVALFGHDFREDRVVMGEARQGQRLYESPRLAKLWPFGIHRIGDLTFESSAYIARYVTKRISGPGASPLPLAILEGGEMVLPNPEFLLCSRRPYIGHGWVARYLERDVLPHGRVITANGNPAPVPRAYKRSLEKQTIFKNLNNPMNRQKAALMLKTAQHHQDNLEHVVFEDQPGRRAARRTIADSQTRAFKRDI